MSDEIVEARAKETTFVSNVSGTAESRNVRQKLSGKQRTKGFLKKRAPLIVIGALLLTVVGIIFLSQSFMPFAIVNRFIEEYNGAGISSVLRSDSILDIQLSSTGTYFGLSENQRTALKDSQVLPADITANGTAVTALVFQDTNGEYRAVVPKSVASSADINSKATSALNNPSIQVSGTPLSVEDALNYATFKDKYSSASKIWRGGNSGWYDSLEDLTEARLAIKRTRFNTWATAAISSADEAWRKMAAGNANASDGGISDYGSYVDTDAEGNETTTTHSGSIDASSLTGSTSMDKVRSILNSKITSVAKVAATAGCAGVEIMSAIQTYMSAQQSLQYLNLATGYFEAVQGAQVGKNNGEPMNEYNKILTTPDPETGKTPMEAATSSALFSGTAVSSSDESVKTVNFETLMSSLGTLSGNVSFTAKAFEACSYVKMGVAATNFVSTVISFIPVLGQAAKAIHIVAKLVGRLALGVTISAIASFIIPKILTQVFKNVAQNVATEWTGEDYFNAMTSGASKYIGGNFQTGGGSAASKTSLGAYLRTKETVIAEQAEQERKNKSPFDLTSRYTFFGSIVYSLIPMATSSSIGSTIRNVGSLISSSATSLLPSASAIAETNLMSSIGDCPVLESVGAVGDALCNRIDIDDTSTMSLTPAEVKEKIIEIDPNAFKGTDSNGQDIINPNSNLGKTATILNQRVATLGVADASAANILVQQPSSIISNIPLVGDVSQIISAMGEAENMPWISGSAGVDSPDNPLWDEIKYYQRYIQDQRLLEVAGITKKSSVTSLLEDFYEQNPLDNSREGIIARYSGMTKDQVIAVEDTIEALTYIANYDPSSRIKFSQNNDAYAIMDSCHQWTTTYRNLDPLNLQANQNCEKQKSQPDNPERIVQTEKWIKLGQLKQASISLATVFQVESKEKALRQRARQSFLLTA